VIALDVEYVFQVTGGPQALQALLTRYDPRQAPAYSTVQMWKSRGVIPGAWIVPVIYALVSEGHDLRTLFHDDAEMALSARTPP
jgi:hypothetical protein